MGSVITPLTGLEFLRTYLINGESNEINNFGSPGLKTQNWMGAAIFKGSKNPLPHLHPANTVHLTTEGIHLINVCSILNECRP